MRAHAEAVRNRLEILALLVDTLTCAPPPGLMYEWSVRGVHQPDNSMIDGARQISSEIRELVLIAERGNPRYWNGRVGSSGESSSGRRRIGNEHPDEGVVFFARIATRVDALDLQLLIRSE